MANPLSEMCLDAVRELDRSLGPRMCGAVVSGKAVPGFRGLAGGESPFELTKRTLVMPVMQGMGYGDPAYGLDGLDGYGGTILAMVPMNRPVDDPLRQVMAFMRGHGTPRGLATDGFMWVLSERGPLGPRVRRSADLRPYYVEALDTVRFRVAVPEDPSAAEEFLRVFGRGRDERPLRVLRSRDLGHDAVLDVPGLRPADRVAFRRSASLSSHTLSASLSTDAAIETMNASYPSDTTAPSEVATIMPCCSMILSEYLTRCFGMPVISDRRIRPTGWFSLTVLRMEMCLSRSSKSSFSESTGSLASLIRHAPHRKGGKGFGGRSAAVPLLLAPLVVVGPPALSDGAAAVESLLLRVGALVGPVAVQALPDQFGLFL